MIGLIIAIFLGVALLFAVPGFVGGISDALSNAILFFVRGILLLAIALLPIFAVVLVLGLFLNKSDRTSIILFGAVYAMVFYFMLQSSGIQNTLLDLVNNYYASWIPTPLATILAEMKAFASMAVSVMLSALDSIYFMLTGKHLRVKEVNKK